MRSHHITLLTSGVVGFCLAATAPWIWGQPAKPDAATKPLPVAAAGDQVTVKREATPIEPPHKYKVSLAVEPVRSTTLVAPSDGIVRQADTKSNSKVLAQAEVVRLDNQGAKLRLQRAEAMLKVATAEQKLAGDKDENHKAAAQGRVDVAKADVELARFELEQSSVRAPFAGEVQRMLVSEGQYVRTGEPLAVVVDTSKLRAEVPVERTSAEVGKSLSIKIESADVDAKIEAILPLGERFGVIRDVFDSVASAVLVIDNPDGRYKVGQTVYVPLIPRQPVAEVPTSAIGNLPDGQRKVQVVRHAVVRDIPVVVMGSVGVNRVFVSGAFAEGDEVIFESSHQLGDSFVLKTAAAPAAGTSTGTNPATQPPASTGNKPVGF